MVLFYLTSAMFSPLFGRSIPKNLRLSWYQILQKGSLLGLSFGLVKYIEIAYKSKSDMENFAS